MAIKKVMVLGTGQMGSGIAQVFASHGIDAYLRSRKEASVEKALARIEKGLNRNVEKGRITEEQKADTLAHLHGVVELTEETCKVDLIVESVAEDLPVKEDILSTVGKLAPADTIIASNTSSVSITLLGNYSGRPEKFIGMHFCNPAPVMKLVEVTKGLATSDETFTVIRDLASEVGKTPVAVHDSAGFVGNRIMIPMINEAIFTLMEGVASKEDIDAVAKLGFNHPMGPLALSDLIGNDTVLAIMEVLYDQFGDQKYRPCPLLRKMVEAGYLGRKSGKGFYEYNKK